MVGSGCVTPENRPELHFAFQIDTTLRRLQTPIIHGLQRFTLSFNRTVVIANRNIGDNNGCCHFIWRANGLNGLNGLNGFIAPYHLAQRYRAAWFAATLAHPLQQTFEDLEGIY